MSKKLSVILIIAIIAALAIVATVFTVAAGVFDPYEQQVRLGYKYLSEMKYEEAVVAFDAAISIEAKRDTAYIGKADAYLAEGGGGAVAKIDESLKAGYGLTQSAKIVDAYVRIADALSANDKDEAALDLLRKGFDVTGNDRLKEKTAGIIDKISSAFMKNLYGLFEAGNIDEVKDIMRTDEFNTVASYATETEPAFYSPTSTGTAKSGKGVGIYTGVYTMQGRHFVYYGDYADNVRSGQGTWLCVEENGDQHDYDYNYMFEGQWASDKPNGEGRLEQVFLGSIPDGHVRRSIKQGTYENGLENGTITWDMYFDNGAHSHWQYTATAGVAPRLSGAENFEDGAYPIAISADGIGVLGQHEGDRMGVSGFSISAFMGN